MTRFLLIRHGSTAAVGRRLAGRTPGVHLDARGRRQADALARWLSAPRHAGEGIAAVCCSPLERALETATPIATLLGLEPSPREEFQELDFGEWTGRGIAELREDARFHHFNTMRGSARVPGGESMPEAQARMLRGLQALRERHPNGAVVVVGHCDPLRATIAHFLGIPLDLMLRFELAPASLSTIDLGEDWVRVVSVNDTRASEGP